MCSGRATGLHGLTKNKTKTEARILSPGSQWDERGRKMNAIL